MASLTTSPVTYQANGSTFTGSLVYQNDITRARPGIVLAPNWMGVTRMAEDVAGKIAAQGFVVLVADLYGEGKRPTSGEEAGSMMMAVKDTPAEVARMQAALTALLEQQQAPVAHDKLAAVGFCFGGHCALELARSGADIKAAVSFHGSLDTKGDYAMNSIKGSVLVLDGAADPLVPREQLNEFVHEMTARQIDWQLVSYAGAAHSFTDPQANNPGVAQYHPQVAERAFTRMFALFAEIF
ncbi:dienelactone hydrolase family protein [Pantoea phytobeneficialis]|uniref:Dienelactone hydrolase n=1 Tax=Pantoea phytobeneficialis TaxID=2052056 RepID=A0AAP9H941_9GAMM|nr:dienelactone hydrolase family protein [Pantoea phytobeneficialis]MDO6409404.1 dienelactone hydrolase family protein [Pantoea phytobeneficialis]QGR08943.1 dienelactone hydrolase [Pantoea phytobeneficialis]